MKAKASKNKKTSRKKTNPFELKFDRTKHFVLGKTKSSKHTGMPGFARKRAFENRVATIGAELKQRGKVNKIVDHRLSIYNKKFTDDERAAKRFIMERLESMKNAENIDGNEEVNLTHKGASLTSIQKYEHTISDDDDDENGEIGADVVSIAHFGGGRQPDSEAHDEIRTGSKRKEMLSELIAKTKQQRFDKQLIRDELENATERLDEKWKYLVENGLIENFISVGGQKTMSKPLVDEYDNLFSELKMSHIKRDDPSRPKTSQDLAAEEKEELIRLEKERLDRIKLKPDDQQIKFVRVESDSSEEATLEESQSSMQETVNRMEDKAVEEINQFDEKFADVAESSSLPFVFDMPKNYTELKDLLFDKTPTEISIVVDRLVKLYHPSLRTNNKKKLSWLLLSLIRFYDELSVEDVLKAEKLSSLYNSIYKLLEFNAEYGTKCMHVLLKRQYGVFCKKRHQSLTFRAIAFINLVKKLFPVAEISHPISTPTLTFALYLVINTKIGCVADVAKILLLIDILSEYIEGSKRYFPEVIAFMRDVFLLAIKNQEQDRFITTSFPVSLPQRQMLLIESDCTETEGDFVVNITDVFGEKNSSFPNNVYNRLSVVRVAVATVAKYVSVYSSYNTSFNAIFSPYLRVISRLPTACYPKILREEILKLVSSINANCQRCMEVQQLQRKKKEIRGLEMLEPRIDPHFDMDKRVSKTADVMVQRRLLKRKVRKEMRGAMKELRKDNQFIARERKNAISRDDKIRKMKVRRLIRELQGQESEFKKRQYVSSS